MLAFLNPSLSVRPAVKRCDSAKVADKLFPQKPVFVQGVDRRFDFVLTQSWSELLFALVLVSSKELYTLPIVTTMLKIGDVYIWRQLMATAVIAAAPPEVSYENYQYYLKLLREIAGIKQS